MAARLSEQEVKNLLTKCSNWEKWGKNDERGALNYITDQKRAAAAKLVQTGEAVSLALPLATIPAPDNPTPVMHLMQQTGFDAHEVELLPYTGDYFAIAPHGLANTHLDALCHVFHNGKMYNGFDASEVGSHGAKKCAIDVASQGVISRGVLLDIPKIKKVEWLDNSVRITPEDLDAAEKDHGVRVEEGDVLFVRTGRARQRKEKGAWDAFHGGMAGLDTSALPWLYERNIAVLGSDGVSDAVPSGYKDLALPIHTCTLVMMGVHLIDNADLDAVAAACARNRRYEFQFVMAPLVLRQGTASPVNPLAIF
ncbi:MAG TPA: cyclase family protein [Candidatus Binataceae bacterium]|nr:cyclase family protein [Candidatus Binataceae bacterium]